jgi:ankyrin repeat protein
MGVKPHANNNRALREACEYGYDDMVRILLDAWCVMADLSIELELACEGGHEIIARMLLDAAATDNSQIAINIHANNNISLLYACKSGKLSLVQLLVQKGANIHSQLDAPLCVATNLGNIDIIEYILSLGPIDEQCSALSIATNNNQPNIVKLLLNAGSTSRVAGMQALFLAVVNEFMEIAKLLLDHGFYYSKIINIASVTLYKLLLQYEQPVVGKEMLLLAITDDKVKLVDAILEYDNNLFSSVLPSLAEVVKQKNDEMLALLVKYMTQDDKDNLVALCCEIGWFDGFQLLTTNCVNIKTNLHKRDDI